MAAPQVKAADVHIRPAVHTEIPVLNTLIQASVRGLQAEDYTPEQIEGALQTVFGVDTQLISDGTYLVAEARSTEDEHVIAGCGGWSKRKTLFGADQWSERHDELLDPRTEAAKIRAFFIHPDWGRRGVGTRLLQACEDAAAAAGFTRFEMGATLTGAKLFAARGYVARAHLSIALLNGASLPIIHMVKQLY
jgi:GNAT superfamily N-acetyltransferase